MSDITVIIPVYNVEDYIVECLDSVIRQTHAPSEILIINDGSTDGSRKICQSYAEKYPIIRLIDQDNQGVASARNKGLDLARGDYLVFVDSDDVIAKNMLSLLLKKATDTGSDIVQSGVYYLYDDYRIEKYSNIEENDVVLMGKKDFFHAMFDRRLSSYMCSSIYRKQLFDDLRFPENKIMEDTFIKPHLFLRSNKIIIIPECLYYYRQRQGSLMHTFHDRRFDIIESMNNLARIIDEFDLSEYYKDELTLWYGYHIMILVKHMAKNNHYFKYNSFRNKMLQIISTNEIAEILNKLKRIVDNKSHDNDMARETLNIYKTIKLFAYNKYYFWLKVKYNYYKKKLIKYRHNTSEQ